MTISVVLRANSAALTVDLTASSLPAVIPPWSELQTIDLLVSVIPPWSELQTINTAENIPMVKLKVAGIFTDFPIRTKVAGVFVP